MVTSVINRQYFQGNNLTENLTEAPDPEGIGDADPSVQMAKHILEHIF